MKTKSTKTLTQAVAFLFGMLVCCFSHAQNTHPLLNTSVTTECITNCLDQDSVPVINDSTTIRIQMTVNVFDETGIYAIQVSLGSTLGGSDLLSKSFAFDQFGNVGNGCTYSRTGEVITLGLGDYQGLSSYFSEVRIERVDHSFTESFVFNR